MQVNQFIALIHMECGHIFRLYYTDSSLIAGRVTAAAVQCPGSFSFIETTVRIVGHHGMAGFRADAIAFRNEQCLVVVTTKRSRFFFLPDGSLAATLTSGADLQCDCRGVFNIFHRAFHRIFNSVHDHRDITAARTAPTRQRLHLAILGNLHPAVRRMVLQCDGGRHDTSPEGR